MYSNDVGIYPLTLFYGCMQHAWHMRRGQLWRFISLGLKPARSIWLKNFKASSAPIMGASSIITFDKDSSLLVMMSNSYRALFSISQFAYKVTKVLHIEISEQNPVLMKWAWTSLLSFEAPKLAHPLTTLVKVNSFGFMLARSIWRNCFRTFCAYAAIIAFHGTTSLWHLT